MKVREIDVSHSDKRSAELFFRVLRVFYDLSEMSALDMFARTGVLTVAHYADHVDQLEMWELGPEHEAALIESWDGVVKIGCSYASMKECLAQYDLIVVDSPQGLHLSYDGEIMTEHFDVMNNISPMLKDKALIVLYVNKSPYNKDEMGSQGYDEYKEYDFSEWMQRREVFYGWATVTEEKAIVAYRRVMSEQGFDLTRVFIVPCYSDVPDKAGYAFRICLDVERRT